MPTRGTTLTLIPIDRAIAVVSTACSVGFQPTSANVVYLVRSTVASTAGSAVAAAIVYWCRASSLPVQQLYATGACSSLLVRSASSIPLVVRALVSVFWVFISNIRGSFFFLKKLIVSW